MSARRRPSRSCSASIILATAAFFVPIRIDHPFWMIAFLVLIAVTFCLFGFIIGIWGQNFEQIQFIPMLIVTPLTFLGGAFYSISMLGEPWRTITHFNPVVYLIRASAGASTAPPTSAWGSASPRPRLLLPLPRHRLVDVPDRLSAEDLTSADIRRRIASPPMTACTLRRGARPRRRGSGRRTPS